MRRVIIKNINGFTRGKICGRIISADTARIVIKDQSGLAGFEHPLENGLMPGDIAEIHYENKNGKLKITQSKLLLRPEINPLEISNSPFYRMIKNNNELYKNLKVREKFFKLVRRFFNKKGFLEIHTPTLVESGGVERYIDPFSTHYKGNNGQQHKFYLPTSPEFALKEALTAGLEKIFEISKSFRNSGENSNIHRPEFFMLEWYRAYCGYEKLFKDCRKLISFLTRKQNGTTQIHYQGHTIDTDSLSVFTVRELFARDGIELDCYTTDPERFIYDTEQILFGGASAVRQNGTPAGYVRLSQLTKEDLFFKYFMERVECRLGFDKPAVVKDYPIEMCTLSNKCSYSDLYGERFELYIAGIEIANGFGELNDPAAQSESFNDTLEFRKSSGKEPIAYPERFIHSLKYGMPPSAGIALGLERLLMLLTDTADINDLSLFDFARYN